MTLLLDTGALIALEHNDRAMWRRLKSSLLRNEVAVTHGGVIGQAWRGRGSRAALLARAIASLDVRPIDENLGKRSGALLAKAKRSDVIATFDSDDLKPLAHAAGRLIDILPI